MFYSIVAEDKPDSQQARINTRPEHLARLLSLNEQGRLLTAGPHPAIDSEEPGEAGFTGSLIIAEFNSLIDAQTWADQDPYIIAGVYAKVVVKPYKKVLP